jgi:hypothetical protein
LCPVATAANLPSGFTEEQFGGNLSGSPTAMAFAPDGRLFVCQQGGQLRVIKTGSLLSLRRTVVLLLKLYFRSRNRQGLHALNNRECPKSVAVSETPATPELELAARLDSPKAEQINSSASAVRNGTGQDTLVWQVERARDGISWK